MIRDAASNIKETLPTPELKTLWDMIVAFADKVNNLNFGKTVAAQVLSQ